MKRILYLLLVVVLISTSCDDFLEVEHPSVVSGDSFWKSEQHLQGGLNGVYNGYLRLFARGEKYWDWGGGRSDNYTPRKDYFYSENLLHNILEPEGGFGDFGTIYGMIAKANTFLANYDKVEGVSQEKVDNYVGQVLALRALAYFIATKVWGDVPYITTPVTSLQDDIYPVRTSQDTIYEKLIIPDLIKAVSLLKKESVNYYVNYYGASAMLMDVYMWRHQYDKAIETFANFGNKYKLVPMKKWGGLFKFGGAISKTSAVENIFVLHWDDLTLKPTRSGVFNNFTYGNPYFHVSNKWAEAALELGDARLYATCDTTVADMGWIDGPSWKFIGADYSPQDYTQEHDFHIPIYRWADIITLHSEALAQTVGVTEEAIVGLNAVRVRAGLPAKTVADFADKDELIDAILKERQVEFYAEAKRWYDLVRTGKVFEVMNPICTYPLTTEGLLWPISERDMIVNENLVQNEAYK
jgi:hypothetical protein